MNTRGRLTQAELFAISSSSLRKLIQVHQGTGTGIWAIHFAKQHPQSHVVGTDLSLIQPDNSPANCEFIRDDIEDSWVFETVFDYIHLRVVFTCFDDPRGVLQRIYDNLKPGGWVEYQDSAMELVGSDDASEAIVQASPLAQWVEYMRVGLHNVKGRDPDVTRKLKGWMGEMGFVDVVERRVLMPVNGWPLDPDDSRLGRFLRLDTEKVVESSVKLLLAGGLTEEALPRFTAAVKWNLGESHMRGYWMRTYDSATKSLFLISADKDVRGRVRRLWSETPG